MISRTGRGGYEDFLDRHPGARELHEALAAQGWTDQQIVGEMVRRIQEARD